MSFLKAKWERYYCCKSPKKVTFVDGEEIGFEGEIIEARANSHDTGDEFDHLIAHDLACTLES